MELLVVIVLVIGLAGIIGNQYSVLKRMESMQETTRRDQG
jgi:Tfp pilus assembly protein PilV